MNKILTLYLCMGIVLPTPRAKEKYYTDGCKEQTRQYDKDKHKA